MAAKLQVALDFVDMDRALKVADEAAAGGPEAAPAAADVEREVIAAHKAMIAAMEAGDVAAMTALMDPSPGLLIFHPFGEDRFSGIREIDEGLSRMFQAVGSVTWTEVHPTIALSGDTAWLTAQVIVKSPSLPEPFVGRGTEIWVHGPEGWRLAHAHWSRQARPAGSATGG